MRPADLRSPLLLGLAGGMRTFAPLAALALSGRFPARLRALLLLSIAGETALDKLPQMHSRLEPPGLATRAVGSGVAGFVAAGPAGAPAAVAAAILSAQACARARAALAGWAGHDLPVAVGEDVLAFAVARAGAGSP